MLSRPAVHIANPSSLILASFTIRWFWNEKLGRCGMLGCRKMSQNEISEPHAIITNLPDFETKKRRRRGYCSIRGPGP